jgi:hypothetical protein
MGQTRIPKCRRDGWTPERQLRFLDALVRTRNVGNAAAAAGMSRESAHRLRERRDGALFAALWDCALGGATGEGHIPPLSDGRLMRVLGNHYRRENNGFWPKRAADPNA